MSNYRHYPDESIAEFRYDDDVEYLVVNEKDWEQNIIVGFSSTSYGIACLYAREHADENWVITLI